MTRSELERHLGKYVEVILFDGTVIEGILHKTGEKAFENDPNLTIPKLRYFCTYGDNVVDRCVFKLSHIKKISRIKIKHGKWLVKEFDLKELEEYIHPYDGLHGTPFCSMCGRNALLNGAEEYVDSNYCPYCGAKMEGKGDEK